MAKSKSIKYINWDKDTIDPVNAGWILPQVIAAVGNYWPIVKGPSGLYSFTETLRKWKTTISSGELDLEGNPINLSGATNLLRWITTSPRGEVLGSLKQTSGEGVRYSAPVPLVLSAWKQYRGVGYSSWDWTDPGKRFFLDHDILEWSEYFGVEQPWEPSELLQFRVNALEVKSGARQGTQRRPESCASVFGVSDGAFKKLPRLMKLSLCQLWCFHPSIRTDLMITNHMDLDSFPTPLVDGEIFQELDKKTKITTTLSSPWDV